MTRVAHFKPPHELRAAILEPKHVIVLTISGCPGNYRGTFDKNLIVTSRAQTAIEIRLNNATHPEAEISLLDFSTTGISRASHPIQDFHIAEGGQSANFVLEMLDNQMIDFGFSVLVRSLTATGFSLEYLFCDPQASNDPKL